ncbi:MAG: bifunctional (p)ppGpp synthetase/guanosine-3',5'-bis(diphosphate) 3'-pyrophosphohydrolase [Armatimonadetes bacterium]|nr:bifunctional (p)ppGpp synthetase/guanosine-3',5'-bis(diphosphate) 3'-pyrophosphohydrolase [Armatimonadota bacterium]
MKIEESVHAHTQLPEAGGESIVSADPVPDLVRRIQSYNSDVDVALIQSAYEFARLHHEGQLRGSGEPYITHPVATAIILTDVEMDASCIAAGLLHDVVEDCKVSLEEIEQKFGAEIAGLVDGVTKLKLADFERIEDSASVTKKRRVELRKNAENLRKIFLAVARDLRVMMIKLADRLHNMSTLYGLPPERQRRIAQETQQIYAPLAHRLGVWKIKWQLEDLAFKYLEPEKYDEMVKMVDRTRAEREAIITEAIEVITSRLQEEGIQAQIQGRPKHLWSIYQKMLKEKVDFSEIYDLSAVRIITTSIPDCYRALGIVHDIWIHINGLFDDYITKAKPNLYQSLHTKVVGPRGEPLEIQIRTEEMHRTAEFGMAAHWQYKEGGPDKNGFDRKVMWLRQQLFDWQADNKEATEFLRSVINDLFTDQVFVFTPAGDVIDLPAGSTAVDFAYRIHSDLGHHCVGARVNGRIVKLEQPLNNGAIVEVVTRSNSAPSKDWLEFVKTSHARNKIKSYFRKLDFNESVQKGRELLDKECDRQGLDRAILKSDNLERVAKQLNKVGEDDLLAAIGFGHLGPSAVFHRLVPQDTRPQTLVPTGRSAEGRVVVKGAESMMVTRAACCLPVPGDEVTGYVSRGKGLVLHRDNCPNLINYRGTEPDRLMKIDWQEDGGGHYQVDIKIESLDRMGLLTDIAAIFSEGKVNMLKANIKSMPDKRAIFELKLEVENLKHLDRLLGNIGKLTDVLKIHRVGGRPKRGRRVAPSVSS